MNDLNQLHARVRLLTKIVVVQLLVTAASFLVAANRGEPGSDTIRTRHLVVVDEHGVQRVHIGAPVPDPIVQGHTSKRDEPAAGVMIYDAAGNERGGYITDNNPAGGNALITLDNATQQAVTLVAYPDSGAEGGVQLDHERSVAFSATPKFTGIRVRHGTVEAAHINVVDESGGVKPLVP